MLGWAVPILLIVLVGLLAAAWATRDGDGRPRAAWVIAAGAIAPLLIATQLWSAQDNGRFGDLRLSVLALKLAPDAIDGASIGGDRVHDFLLVGDLPASLITLHRISDREVGLVVARPLRGEIAGAVAFENAEPDFASHLAGASPRLAGERAVREGEVFCPRGCASACRIRLPVDGDRLALDGVSAADLPRMEERGSVVSWGPGQRIYPLRTFAATGGCGDALQGDAGKGLPVTAFLFRHGGLFANQLYGMFLDAAGDGAPDAMLTRGGPGLKIHLYRVDYTQGGYAEEHDRPSRIVERRSVTARLSQDGDLTIAYDTPEDLQLPARAIANVIAAKPGEDIVLPIDNDRGAGRPFIGDSTLQFRSLGGQLAETALGRVLLHPDRKSKALAPYFSVVGGGQTRNVRFSDHFSLGSSYSAEFTLERLARDAGALGLITWLFLLFVTLASLAATWSARRASLPALALVTLTEALLALRLLIAISGSYVDATAARAAIVPSALFAFLAVPFLIAHVASAKRSFLATLSYALLIGIVGMAAAREFGLDKTSVIVGALVGVAVMGDALAQPALPEQVRRAVQNVGARLRFWLSYPMNRLRAQIWYPAQIGRPLAGLALLIVVRLALLLFGLKEGIPLFGFRVALSTVYLPLALIMLARLLVALRAGDDGALWRPLLWSVAVALTFATPIAARDTGFIIFALGTAVLGIVALLNRRAARPDPWLWPAGLLLLPLGFLLICYVLLHSFIVDSAAGFVVSGIAALAAVAIAVTAMRQSERLAALWQGLPLGLLALAALLSLVPFFALADLVDAAFVAGGAAILFLVLWKQPLTAWLLPVAFAVALGLSFQLPVLPSATFAGSPAVHDETAERELENQMHKTQNILRIWYSVRPGDIGDFATSSAQNLGAAMAHLHDYGACPDSNWPSCLAGHGYLAIPRPTVLAPYQLNDNVTAIHLIAPFGRLGAAAFLLLLAAVALLYTRAALTSAEPPSPLVLAGVAALWTIFGAALFMILANLEVLPFTGKNVYFLAAGSGSDLLEGTILVALAMAAMARVRA
ncbi:MAG TPA: hypothetical protein VII56_15025 [Rhizomicrobium sp.]